MNFRFVRYFPLMGFFVAAKVIRYSGFVILNELIADLKSATNNYGIANPIGRESNASIKDARSRIYSNIYLQ